VRTGGCGVAGPAAPAGRDGRWWAVPGSLCGMSRPGLLDDADAQFRRLHAEGVRQLFCIEERCAYPVRGLRDLGIAHYHLPVPDMAAPSFAQGVDLCRLGESALRQGAAIAVHCRGGLGRTGTALAAVLVWFGDTLDVRSPRFAPRNRARSRALPKCASYMSSPAASSLALTRDRNR